VTHYVFLTFPRLLYYLVKVAACQLYISWPYIVELGFKPDLVYNPSVVAPTAISLPVMIHHPNFSFLLRYTQAPLSCPPHQQPQHILHQ
jgi:hypothetical protein